MLTLTDEGVYYLSVKPKSVECWSAPLTLRVILPDEALQASFDYVLNNTGKKEESSDRILGMETPVNNVPQYMYMVKRENFWSPYE